MINNTTIWTQTNLAQWAESSNKGSWYKYTQASRSFNSYIKSKISTSANLISNIEGTDTPVESWVEVDTTQWVPGDRKQWLDLFRGYKSLFISIFPETKNHILDLKGILKSMYPDNYDLLSTIYGGYSSLSNIAAVIRSIPIEITSWTDNYKSQWWSDDSVQWVDFLFSSKELNIIIKGFGNQSLDLLSVLQASRNLYSDLGGYITQCFIDSINLDGYLKTQKNDYSWFIKIIRGWVKDNRDLRLILQTSRHSYFNLNVYTKQFSSDDIDLPGYIKFTHKQYSSLLKIICGWKKDNIDLRLILKGIKHSHINLNAYTNQFSPESKDLIGYIKYTYKQYFDFKKTIRGWKKESIDLLKYIKGTEILYSNLGSFLRGIDSYTLFNLSKYIKSTKTTITSFFKIIQGWGSNNIDLGGYTKLFTSGIILNLLEYIKSTKITHSDIGSYLQTTPPLNLPINIELIEPLNLQVYLTVNDRIIHLGVYIHAFNYKDVNLFIRPVHLFNLLSYLNPITPVNLQSSLFGWEQRNLFFTVLPILPPEINISIFAIAPKNLKIIINGYKGIEKNKDLYNFIRGVVVFDLPINLIPVGTRSYNDLVINLFAKGQISDLQIEIRPRVIFMKALISVSLLEHKDLSIAINNGCIHSLYKDLSIYSYCVYLKELKVYMKCAFGKQVEFDLGATVNYTDYTVVDYLDVEWFVGDRSDLFTQFDVLFYNHNGMTVIDEIPIVIGTLHFKELKANLTCILSSLNLSISIKAIEKPKYKFLPEWVDIKAKRIVIDTARVHKQWHRIVDLFFDSRFSNPHYFYVEAENKLYPIDRDVKWTVLIKSYKPNPDKNSDIKKLSIRSKYFIRLSDFKSIDEAVKYFIDLVSTYRTIDLAASLYVVLTPRKDLNCYLYSNYIHKWSKRLGASIIGDYIEINLRCLIKPGFIEIKNLRNIAIPTRSMMINLQNRIGYKSSILNLISATKCYYKKIKPLLVGVRAGYKNIFNLIMTVRYYSSIFNINSIIKTTNNTIKDININIVPVGYLPPVGNNIIFNFMDGGYTPTEYNELNFNFDSEVF